MSLVRERAKTEKQSAETVYHVSHITYKENNLYQLDLLLKSAIIVSYFDKKPSQVAPAAAHSYILYLG